MSDPSGRTAALGTSGEVEPLGRGEAVDHPLRLRPRVHVRSVVPDAATSVVLSTQVYSSCVGNVAISRLTAFVVMSSSSMYHCAPAF